MMTFYNKNSISDSVVDPNSIILIWRVEIYGSGDFDTGIPGNPRDDHIVCE